MAAPGLVVVPLALVDVLVGEREPGADVPLVFPVDDGPGDAILVPTLVPEVLVWAEATPSARTSREGAIHSFCISRLLYPKK